MGINYSLHSDIPQAPQYKQKHRQRHGAQEGGSHHHAGGQRPLMPHIFSHDIAAHRGGRAQHDQQSHQHFFPETQPDGKGQEEGGLNHQL